MLNLKALVLKLGGRITGQTDVLEAILAIGILAAAADGKLDREEVQEVVNHANSNPVVNKLFPADVVSQTKDLVVQRLKTGGREGLYKELRDCATKTEEIRHAIFMAGTAVAAIGGIDDKERAVLVKAADEMNILTADRDDMLKAVIDDKIEFDL